ncbi:MAG: Ig-like domain-containing protein, partial [Lachnospiraceae bacterium]|nr:Ig-like domain-containing protein [Lachnospiraceae bacterium]
GEKLELEAELNPKNSSDKDIEWTSDKPGIATVKDGVVTGVAPGYTIIKCISVDGEYMDYCMLTVIELVSDIVFDPDYVEVGVGKKLTLNVLISGETASNKTLKWSSKNKKICKVDKKGIIKGVKVGKTIIRARATDGSGAVGECEVRVIRATKNLETEPSFMQLVEGEKKKITYKITPKKATYKVPLFKSDNEDIAVVDKKGNVTGLKAGNCVVTATSKDNPALTAKTVIKVIAPVNATSVTFAESEVVMVPGESKTVPYSIVPSNFTESYTWSSDNPVVATVNENTGKITARSVGAATITLMTKSGKRGTVRVYVVGLSRSSVTLHQYESLKIKLEIDGTGSENLTVRWDTDNQSIAEIANGRVTGKALGTTKVYAIVNGRWLECVVKVVPNLRN